MNLRASGIWHRFFLMPSLLTTFLGLFERADRIFKHLVQGVLVIVLLSMISLVFAQVLLRGIFNSGITWADVVGRHMVLWIAFLGAMLATRSRQHISIDLAARLVPRRARNALRFMLDVVACIVCCALTIAAVKFVIAEHEMETVLFAGIPLWTIGTIIPFGFATMTFEYAVGVVLDILRFIYNGSVSRLASERRPV